MNTPTFNRLPSQRGAALGVALVLLIVLTLLGVAAVRATQTELRLSQNAESHTAAQQAAESVIGSLLEHDTVNFVLDENPDYRVCYPVASASVNAPLCSSTDTAANIAGLNSYLAAKSYAEVKRQLPLFVPVDVLREIPISARSYDFARFSITGGYDSTASGFSAAEVNESRLVLHTKAAGTTYQ